MVHRHHTPSNRLPKAFHAKTMAVLFVVLYGFASKRILLNSLPAQKNQLQQTAEKRSPYRHVTHFNNSFSNAKASACSQQQIDAISNTLGINGRNILPLTNCPKSNWIENYYKTKLARGNHFFLGINIGCNKGYDAVKIARMGTGNSKFDTDDWAKSMISSGVDSAGVCGQMLSSKLQLDSEDGSSRMVHNNQGEVHCVEPLLSTVRALKNSSRVLGLEDEGLVIFQAAISSSDGSAYFPNPLPGTEQGSLASCEDSKNNCLEVPVYSLETYVETYVENQGPVNILSIDVEGYDFDVLFGAGSVLDRTEYLEFEYHNVGNWGTYHLTDAVRLLDGKGFTCYWAGIEKLWRITNCYINGLYDWHGWSNVACVHRSQIELADIMESIFNETVGSN